LGVSSQDCPVAARLAGAPFFAIRTAWLIADADTAQVWKNTSQTTPRINTASPVETVRRTSTDGPGSAWRASVGVSTIWRCCLVALVPSIPGCHERPAARLSKANA